ncbi:MAG: DciA family protein [Pseudomonadota bacterium]|nr:DciA family protein [Pseudomonadota bacterium]
MTSRFSHFKRRRSTRLRPLSSLTEKLVAPGLQKRSRFLAKLISDWPVIAGDVAMYCLPVDLQFPKHKRMDGTLVLSVVSGRAPQLQMMSRDLIIQINRSLGFAAVGRIRLRQDLIRPAAALPDDQGETEAPQDTMNLHQLETATSGIQSPELRAALIRLGRNIRR